MTAKIILTDEQIQRVKTLFDREDLGERKIAKEAGITVAGVHAALEILGVSNSGRTHPRTNHKLTEKLCKKCKKTKLISEFRTRQTQSALGDMILRIEHMCKLCEITSAKEYYDANIEECRKRVNDWNKTHREDINKRERERLKNDPEFAMRRWMSVQVRKVITGAGSSKDEISCLEFLPYTSAELKQHIEGQFESWMNWKNYGKYDREIWDDDDPKTWLWNIDHIEPQSNLPFDTMEHPNFLKCCGKENLRPLSAKQNLFDKNYRSPEEIAKIKKDIANKK